MRITLLLPEFSGFNTPEAILGIICIAVLLISIVAGFFYKRHQSRKNKN